MKSVRFLIAFAVALASGVSSAAWWTTGNDLATFTPPQTGTEQLGLQPHGTAETFTLSTDVDFSNVFLELSPYDGGKGTKGSVVLDMAAGGNHRITLYKFQTRIPASDVAGTRDILVKGGVMDFSPSSTIGLDGVGAFFLAAGNPHDPVYDGTTFTNVWQGILHSDVSDSTVVFKNGTSIDVPSATGASLYFVRYAYDGTSGLQTKGGAVRFESGARLTTPINVFADTRSASASALPFVESTPVSTPIVFTGKGTYFSTGTIQCGNYVRGQKFIIEDGAAGVCGNSGFILGSDACGKESELLVTGHAAFTNRAGLTIGKARGSDGCRVVVSDGAELVCSSTDTASYDKNLYVGWQGDNNEFVLSNATLKAGGFYMGYQGAGYCSVTGNVARFVGPDTQLYLSGFYPFASSYNTLVFDNVNLDKPSYGINYWVNLSEMPSNNTVRIENDATLNMANVLMGRRDNAAYGCNDSSFVLNDSTLTLQSQFLQAGCNCTLSISNGTMNIVGGNGFDMACADESAAGGSTYVAVGNRVFLKGAHPRIFCKADDGHINFNTADVELDMSETPAEGYEEPVLEAARITFADHKLSLKGVGDLYRRMREAGSNQVDVIIAKASSAGNLVVYDTNVRDINQQLSLNYAGLRLVENPAGYDGCLVLQLDLRARTVYLVPAGTVGNTPTAPYDSWETAANTIAVATEAAGPFGTVNALSGTYAGASAGINPTCSAQIRVYADRDMQTPGTLTIDQRIWGGTPVESETRERNAFVFAYGNCFLHQTGSGNMFTDHHGSTTGKESNYSVTFTGEDTYFYTDSGNFYMCYMENGTLFRVTDHAVADIPAYIQFGSAGTQRSTLIIDDGAVVTNLGGMTVQVTPDNRVIVSNATFCTANFAVNASSTTGLNSLTLAGAAPVLKSVTGSGKLTAGKGTRLFIDVSEAPLAGYAEPIMSAPSVTIGQGALVLQGVAALRQRLIDAGRHNGAFRLVRTDTTGSLSIENNDIAAINAELATTAPGFALYRSPDAPVGGLLLYYSDGTVPACAVPPGAAGHVPQSPYDSWATAADSLSRATQMAGPNGFVHALSGTYVTDPNAGINPATAAEIRMYADESCTKPGELTIIQRVFGGTAQTMDDPAYNAFRFGYGTCHLNRYPSGTANFFTDYSSGNVGGWANYRLTFFGADTIVDSDASTFYLGYRNRGTTLTLTDHVTASLTGISIGANVDGANASLVISDGAELTHTGTLTVHNGGNGTDPASTGGNRLVVSNATLKTGSVHVLTAAENLDPNRLVVAGAAPVVTSTVDDGIIRVRPGSVLDFDVSEAPLSKYATAPLSAGTIQLEAGSVFNLTGFDTLLARIQAAGVERVSLTLAVARKGAAFNLIDDGVLLATQATVPAEFTLKKVGGTLKLTFGPPPGGLLIVR